MGRRRTMKQLVLATLGLIAAAGAAEAQVGVPGQRPTRPIINPFLPSRQTSPLTPQQADTLRQLGQQLQTGGTLGKQVTDPTPGITGHPVQYFYYSHYYKFPFPRIPAGTPGGGAPPVAQSGTS